MKKIRQFNMAQVRNYSDDAVLIESMGLHYIDRGNRYYDLNQRISSFLMWPSQIKQSGYAMAISGQVYSGRGDRTYCFKCKYSFTLWSANDDPWEQHAMWSPQCQYVIEMKGRIFMKEMEKQRKIVLERPINLDAVSYRNPVVSCATPRMLALPSRGIIEIERTQEAEKFVCKICCSEPYEIAFNCGHVSTCEDCSLPLIYCPICRCEILTRLKIYFQ